ncbi:hypothetical protein [Chamaesiphon minutus]|uniref:Uncharacterized protein n=1 Tax=Chamaesiphon minutus (strain ATCC 27169 / PCC 6605) TaxID=1173020 RepID=K9UFS0_CHAP6|nr:hypothetical protein [Chamaesiphon minutus]AFY93957.1 hypothetical protein Cha6605_2925 [Chamaesiphon minutus PCC 6605]
MGINDLKTIALFPECQQEIVAIKQLVQTEQMHVKPDSNLAIRHRQ